MSSDVVLKKNEIMLLATKMEGYFSLHGIYCLIVNYRGA